MVGTYVDEFVVTDSVADRTDSTTLPGPGSADQSGPPITEFHGTAAGSRRSMPMTTPTWRPLGGVCIPGCLDRTSQPSTSSTPICRASTNAEIRRAVDPRGQETDPVGSGLVGGRRAAARAVGAKRRPPGTHGANEPGKTRAAVRRFSSHDTPDDERLSSRTRKSPRWS